MSRDEVTYPDGVDGLVQRIEEILSLDELRAVLEQLQQHYGLTHVSYVWIDKAGGRYGATTLSAAWLERYHAREYFRVDPVLTACFSAIDPVDWRDLSWTSRLTSAFRKDATAHGMGWQGYSVPLRGPAGQFAIFSVTSDWTDARWQAFQEEHGRDLIVLGHYLNRVVLELTADPQPKDVRPNVLSPRELETLSLLAEGRSRARVAEMLEISEHTLRVYIESARKKLGAQNTTHAVAKAVATGLISI